MTFYFIPFNILLMAIDVVEFFLLVNLVMTCRDIPWLRPFETAGKDLVNGLTAFTDNLFQKFTGREITAKTNILIWITILELLRLAMGLILC